MASLLAFEQSVVSSLSLPLDAVLRLCPSRGTAALLLEATLCGTALARLAATHGDGAARARALRTAWAHALAAAHGEPQLHAVRSRGGQHYCEGCGCNGFPRHAVLTRRLTLSRRRCRCSRLA